MIINKSTERPYTPEATLERRADLLRTAGGSFSLARPKSRGFTLAIKARVHAKFFAKGGRKMTAVRKADGLCRPAYAD